MFEQSFTIADLRLDLTSERPTASLGLDGRLGAFYGVSPRSSGRVALTWRAAAAPMRSAGELVYDPGAIWRMYRAGEHFEAEISYHGLSAALLRTNAAWDEIGLTEYLPSGPYDSVLALGAGELVLRTALLRHGGLVLHSAGLDDNGRGVVFVGHSGAGKSTQCELWADEPGVVAMNDDRIAIRPDGEGMRCYGTPWGGTADIARNHAAPLSALVIIEQAPENRVDLVPPARAASLVLARAFLPFWDAGLMAQAAANLSYLLARVPVYRLRCRPEPAVIELVRSVL